VDVQLKKRRCAHLPGAARHQRGFTVPTPISVILEVQQQLGEGRVRTVAMEATDGMVRA